MKRIKSLIIAGLGALILGLAAIPVSAQTWDRNRTYFPEQRREFRTNRRYRDFERRREFRNDWRFDRYQWERRRLEELRRERRFDNRFRNRGGLRIIF
jgi:hypothetical protein